MRGSSDLPVMPDGATAPLVAAMQLLLRPLVRLLVSNGVPFTYTANLLKGLYVEIAEDDFPVPDKRQTDSRISLLSGVHRKDVKAFRAARRTKQTAPRVVSLGAQVIARWLADHVDGDGNPVPLSRLDTPSGKSSFQSLVQSVSTDIRPRAILDEWLRLGIVRIDTEDRVCLNTSAFIPEKGSEEKIGHFGRNLHDHMAAGVQNLAADGAPFLERSVYYNHLTQGAVTRLAELSEDLGMEALKAVNRRALELQRRDSGRGDARVRMNFGIYFFSESENAPTTTPESSEEIVDD
ncbi:MAG: hypothetical protein HQ511_06565 [Rhodospirillales bacterium]|nr:hypothetical protein [Rhodospirillales bacterium]